MPFFFTEDSLKEKALMNYFTRLVVEAQSGHMHSFIDPRGTKDEDGGALEEHERPRKLRKLALMCGAHWPTEKISNLFSHYTY